MNRLYIHYYQYKNWHMFIKLFILKIVFCDECCKDWWCCKRWCNTVWPIALLIGIYTCLMLIANAWRFPFWSKNAGKFILWPIALLIRISTTRIIDIKPKQIVKLNKQLFGVRIGVVHVVCVGFQPVRQITKRPGNPYIMFCIELNVII